MGVSVYGRGCAVLVIMSALLAVAEHDTQAAAPSPTHRKFAYATVLPYPTTFFYSEEQLLATRVLLQSLKPLEHPFLVLVAETVAGRIRDALAIEGATIIEVEGDFQTRHVEPHLLHVLQLWSLTEFDRIIYMHTDTVVTNKPELDELAMCGHFCAIYSNPCVMNTGLMVIKPDENRFKALRSAVSTFDPSATPSFFSIEQYFLSNQFKGCSHARLFDRSKGNSDEAVQRLHFAYNMPAFYFFEKKSWDLFRCGIFENLPDPAASLTYAGQLPWVLKPWFWWTTIVQPNWPWLNVRALLVEKGLWFNFFGRAVVCVLFFGLLFNRLVTGWLNRRCTRNPSPLVQRFHDMFGSLVLATVITLTCALTCLGLAVLSFPATMPPFMAWPLFALFFHSYLLVGAKIVSVGVLCVRGANNTLAVRPWDLRWSLLGVFLAAILPYVDEFVSQLPGVRWNLVMKVVTTVPVLIFAVGAQFMIFYSMVRASPLAKTSPLVTMQAGARPG